MEILHNKLDTQNERTVTMFVGYFELPNLATTWQITRTFTS